MISKDKLLDKIQTYVDTTDDIYSITASKALMDIINIISEMETN